MIEQGESAIALQPSSIAPPPPDPVPEPKRIQAFDGVTVILNDEGGSRVELEATTCLEAGWLEQIACSPRTREHESLLVVTARPSQIHAALLMAGFESGSPGRWTYENNMFGAIDPTGEALEIIVRYASPDHDGEIIEHAIGQWIRDPNGGAPFPDDPWIFGGSRFAPNPDWMEPAGGEHYVADMTGSIIGLVTFGDEVIGYSKVLADSEAVQPPMWEANPDTMPPVSTPVTLIIRKAAK